MIYDYLFYKSYQLAQRSKNFEDTPVIGGIWFGVLPCAMFHAFTLMFLIDTVFQSELSRSFNFIANYKYFFSGILVVLILLYYKRKERWKSIVAKYEEKEGGKGIHPAIVLTIAYIGSFVLLLLAGMYKNGDGIFA
jgi:sulfite exporter TauE/SafE